MFHRLTNTIFLLIIISPFVLIPIKLVGVIDWPWWGVMFGWFFPLFSILFVIICFLVTVLVIGKLSDYDHDSK